METGALHALFPTSAVLAPWLPTARKKDDPRTDRQRQGAVLPGSEAADKIWTEKKIDLSMLERLLGGLLANQLASVHDQATGGTK